MRDATADLQRLTQRTESALSVESGEENAHQAMAWFRLHPDEALSARPATTAAVKMQIAMSLEIARTGDKASASRTALAAYLDKLSAFIINVRTGQAVKGAAN